jgi:hypothetical protein
MVIEPIFEADFLPCSFGFRPRRAAHDALQVLLDESFRGRRWVVETDIANCFEAIGHSELMQAIEERICDQAVLKLLRAMLRAGVLLDGSVRRAVTGTPQGGVVTPPTQWITRRMVTLRVGAGVVVGAAGGVLADRDAVADGDVVGSDEDVFDDQPQNALAFLDMGGGGSLVQVGEEPGDVGGEGEVELAVGLLGVQGADLVVQVGFPGAEIGHAGT